MLCGVCLVLSYMLYGVCLVLCAHVVFHVIYLRDACGVGKSCNLVSCFVIWCLSCSVSLFVFCVVGLYQLTSTRCPMVTAQSVLAIRLTICDRVHENQPYVGKIFFARFRKYIAGWIFTTNLESIAN